ncbi:LRC14 protein, partial [Rhabdornis inornatus]|nr:LRC14 protein [Rhabdornis inornatus]
EDCIDCIQAVIQAVVAQLQRELEEPGCDFSLRVLDMTGLWGFVSGNTLADTTIWSITEVLAKACVEVSKHQQEFQRRGSKQRKGCSGAVTV